MASWTDAPEGEVHGPLASRLSALQQEAQQRWATWLLFEQAYADDYWIPRISTQDGADVPMAVNRARILVETYSSKLIKNRVLPMVQVRGGDYGLRRRARLANQFLDQAFSDLGVYDQDTLVATDLGLCGVAFAHVYDDGDQPIVERVDPFEILLSTLDWQYGKGREIHRQRVYDRDMLAERYPEHASAILAAPQVTQDSPLVRTSDYGLQGDSVLVTFSWRRPSGKGSNDGRHCITLPTCTLEDHLDWDDELPFAICPRSKPRRGIWGAPLMADLLPAQETLTEWVGRITESMHLMCNTKIIVTGDDPVVADQITNGTGEIIRIKGNGDVKTWSSEGISPQAFQFVSWLESEMQTLGRTSLLSTQGQVPANIRSARALQLLEDVDGEGLREPMRLRDSFYVRIAELLISTFDRLGGFATMVKDQTGLREVKYSDIRIRKGDYRLTVAPTAFSAKNPAARVDQAEHLVEIGLLPKSKMASWCDLPDLESDTQTITAQEDAIQHRIDLILEDGEYLDPHPFLDLTLLRKTCGDWIVRAEAEGYPEERIQLLMRMALDAKRLLDMQNPAPAPPGPPQGPPDAGPPAGGPPGPPMGPPGPPPN